MKQLSSDELARMRFFMSKKPKLYSYIRWSTDKQSSGTTLDRQLNQARELAKEYDLELIEMIDEGLSAFKGLNKKRGRAEQAANQRSRNHRRTCCRRSRTR